MALHPRPSSFSFCRLVGRLILVDIKDDSDFEMRKLFLYTFLILVTVGCVSSRAVPTGAPVQTSAITWPAANTPSPTYTSEYILSRESNDLESAVRLIKDALLATIPPHFTLDKGYPKLETHDRDLWPIYAANVDEPRTSYRLILNKQGDKVEIFYRKENETETRWWSFTAYIVSPGTKVHAGYTQRIEVHVVTEERSLYEAVRNALQDVGAKEYYR